MDFNITRSAHAEIRVTDLAKSRRFYVDALGLMEIDSDSERIFLGCYEERDKYSLVLKKSKTPGIGHLSFRVANEADLDKIAAVFEKHDCQTKWIEPNSEEPGQGRALRAQDPSGLPVEFYHKMEQREWKRQSFHEFRGANILRIDHFNCQVPRVQKAFDFWTKELGFYFSEGMFNDQDDSLWAAWLHRKQNVHDLALMEGIGPRLHHIGLWCADTLSVLKACDVLASMDMTETIERGPGRHGLSNAFFLYLRDPDGNRIELYTTDYIIADPDFEPVRWKMSDKKRATFWGHPAPRSWFEEASLVEDIETRELLPTQDPVKAGEMLDIR
ncbi:MAG: 3,4-dihydroxyphenylacetate 2,3-dioxygenase [Deltaproteobacteria bacterium]|nr:3,4-dihydroxyphenylacetate 2,3-dioxygenase [Deltaproteobacteria bacterium]